VRVINGGFLRREGAKSVFGTQGPEVRILSLRPIISKLYVVQHTGFCGNIGPVTLARSLPFPQHDPPHRPAADALDTGDQLHLPCPAAAPVVAHPVEDGAERLVASLRRKNAPAGMIPPGRVDFPAHEVGGETEAVSQS